VSADNAAEEGNSLVGREGSADMRGARGNVQQRLSAVAFVTVLILLDWQARWRVANALKA
jgi:hypothetical protein